MQLHTPTGATPIYWTTVNINRRLCTCADDCTTVNRTYAVEDSWFAFDDVAETIVITPVSEFPAIDCCGWTGTPASDLLNAWDDLLSTMVTGTSIRVRGRFAWVSTYLVPAPGGFLNNGLITTTIGGVNFRNLDCGIDYRGNVQFTFDSDAAEPWTTLEFQWVPTGGSVPAANTFASWAMGNVLNWDDFDRLHLDPSHLGHTGGQTSQMVATDPGINVIAFINTDGAFLQEIDYSSGTVDLSFYGGAIAETFADGPALAARLSVLTGAVVEHIPTFDFFAGALVVVITFVAVRYLWQGLTLGIT